MVEPSLFNTVELSEYRGLRIRMVQHDPSMSKHTNRQGEKHPFSAVWHTVALGMPTCIAYFPQREGGTYWIVDLRSYEDSMPGFHDDDGPYETLQEALDKLYIGAVITRITPKAQGDNT
jgi:hypothetical protein